MTAAPNDNAAIFFIADGFDPKSKGINGRRVAGESFIRGFFRHVEATELVCLASGKPDHDLFDKIAQEERPDLPRRHVDRQTPQRIAPAGTLFFPSPNYSNETWMRAAHGPAAWSICGVTHTISTKGVMQGFYDLRMADQREWDAIICTSRAVQASLLRQYDLIDDFMRSRFHANPPARPQIPVIPLGVNVNAFASDAAAGKAMRAQLGAGKNDIVFTCIARLNHYEKFDPLPMFAALRQASERLPKRKLHLALCGIYQNDAARKLFEEGAAKIMPDVAFHVLNGADAEMRKGVLSGGDVYVFPIDNVQETFGLAPVEAMAAGLPVIASDWDGLRDTVTDDVGIRIPTETLEGHQSSHEALRHMAGVDNHSQYCTIMASMTRIDVAKMADAMVTLAEDPDLRRKMGAAGLERARRLYDWSVIVPQMQALWSELGRRRLYAKPPAKLDALPVAPPTFQMFDSYPTRQIRADATRYVLAPAQNGVDIDGLHQLRVLGGVSRYTAMKDHLIAAEAAIAKAGTTGLTIAEVAGALNQPPRVTERIVIWLLKYDFIRQA